MGRFIVSRIGFRAVRDVRRGLRAIVGHASAAVRPIRSACTSPLVGRRDPLGVGLRGADRRLSRRVHARTRQTPLIRPTARRYRTLLNYGKEPHQVRPARRQARLARIYGPGSVAGRLARPLVDEALGPARLVRTDLPVGDATALGTFRTRLETRTKESNMCASHWDLERSLKAQ